MYTLNSAGHNTLRYQTNQKGTFYSWIRQDLVLSPLYSQSVFPGHTQTQTNIVSISCLYVFVYTLSENSFLLPLLLLICTALSSSSHLTNSNDTNNNKNPSLTVSSCPVTISPCWLHSYVLPFIESQPYPYNFTIICCYPLLGNNFIENKSISVLITAISPSNLKGNQP